MNKKLILGAIFFSVGLEGSGGPSSRPRVGISPSTGRLTIVRNDEDFIHLANMQRKLSTSPTEVSPLSNVSVDCQTPTNWKPAVQSFQTQTYDEMVPTTSQFLARVDLAKLMFAWHLKELKQNLNLSREELKQLKNDQKRDRDALHFRANFLNFSNAYSKEFDGCGGLEHLAEARHKLCDKKK